MSVIVKKAEPVPPDVPSRRSSMRSQMREPAFSPPPVEEIIENNCTVVHKADGSTSCVSTPFIAALSGTILLALGDRPELRGTIRRLREYLGQFVVEHPLACFYIGENGEPDIDTTACIHASLAMSGSRRYSFGKRMGILLDELRAFRCSETGAFRTWLHRDMDRIDYMANVNLYFLFRQLRYHDEGLCSYLIRHIRCFLAGGSYYYRDLSLPLFLLHIYRGYEKSYQSDGVFQAIHRSTFEHAFARKRINDILNHCRKSECSDLSKQKPFTLVQHFNSSDKIFHSPVLDRVINTYLYLRLAQRIPSRSVPTA